MSKKGKNYYFRYRNPVTGKETGMGSNRQRAITAANEINAKLIKPEPDLVARVLGGDSLMSNWLDRYTDLYAARKVKGKPISPASIRSIKVHIKQIRARFGDRDIDSISTMEISDYLDTFEDTPTMAKCMRSTMNNVFKTAITKGLIKSNPVTVTTVSGAEVQRERLTLDDFKIIYDAAERLAPWVRNSMFLAMTTGQRLNDITNMQFRDVQDGYLHIQQHKTLARIRLSLDLGLPGIGTIGDAISQCRDAVVSRYMIHHVRNHTKAKKGDGLHRHSVSKGFLQARRNTDLTWTREPPTFHEIRSLAGRLYNDQDIDVQSLLGHADPKTTAIYKDSRGAEWVSVG